MSQTSLIPITNVVNISVALSPTAFPNYNVNNICLFTTDAFLSNPNSDLYRIYNSASGVGSDFGTSTETYQQAVAVFGQQPNILAGGGNLIIAPIQSGAITAVAIRTAGSLYKVGDVLTVVESSTGAVGGQLTVATLSGSGVATVTISSPGFNYTSVTNLSVTGGNGTGCVVDVSSVATETLAQAFSRVSGYLYFNGVLSTNYGANTTWAALAAVVQATGVNMLFLPSNTSSDILGYFATIQTALDTNTRCLYMSTSALASRLFAAAYASRLLSVAWSGSNTALTMNLKQLVGVVPDQGLSTSLLATCVTAGVDVYGNYGGSFPGVVCNGNNKYADEIANLIWFVTSLQVNGFNALALTSTKVPQTENGISILKGAYRQICAQAVANGYIAPGSWTSPDTFGNQTDFLNNITQYGFYIYSAPVSAQTSADRTARKAPLIQIAVKEAGAVQSSNVVVFINP